MEQIYLNMFPTWIKPTCHISQNDNERNVRVNLVDNGVPHALSSGDSVSLHVLKPDGETVSVNVSSTPGNTYVILDVTDDMCNINGKNICELRIENGSVKIGTSNFYMEVEEIIGEVGPLPPPEPPTPQIWGGNFSITEIDYGVGVTTV